MNNKFVFVGGLHRSGTSILFKCLRDHPMVSGFEGTGVPEDEGQHLQSVFSPARAYGGGSRFGFYPEAHLTETSSLMNLQNRDRLWSEWKQYWDISKPFLLEKSPPNLIRTRFLQAMFPGAYFVIIMRHPIAYACPRQSESKIKGIYSLLKHWIVCHEILMNDSSHIKNLFVIKYEEFVSDPEMHLGRIYAFLRCPPHPTHQTVKSDINQKYFAAWDRKQTRPLSRPCLDFISWKFERNVNRFGYSLYDHDVLDPWSPVQKPKAG